MAKVKSTINKWKCEKKVIIHMKKFKNILRDKQGMSTLLTASLVLVLLLLLCVISEFFRLSITASGVRNSLQEAVISVATTNYNEVYNGLREGYSGGYYLDEDGWVENLDYGDIYSQLDRTLGTNPYNGYQVKWQGEGYEFRISGLEVSIKNVPLTPGSAGQNFEAEAAVQLEVPLSFGWENLPPLQMKIKTKAAYMPKF
ncbi:hypothetical protein EDD76_108186 [Kineothrix alysoides]|uniref:PilX-like prepilin protein n=2 Tax=Kineothrix alysoides TaxID=1469948 RepID=A0A4R1QWF0_9FIRM|nr:hypothetical protein EDD76_108186 [Kineothrix alysoides]